MHINLLSAEQSVVRKANDRQCKAKARTSETELESVVRKAKNRQSMSTQILENKYSLLVCYRGGWTPETQLPSEEDSTSVMSTGIDGIEVQCIGVPFVYTIPSLKCITFTVRQITFRAVVSDGSTRTYDGFVRDDPCLEIEEEYPRVMDVLEGCFVKVNNIILYYFILRPMFCRLKNFVNLHLHTTLITLKREFILFGSGIGPP